MNTPRTNLVDVGNKESHVAFKLLYTYCIMQIKQETIWNELEIIPEIIAFKPQCGDLSKIDKVSSSYHLCVDCFSQLSFDSEVYTKLATAAVKNIR